MLPIRALACLAWFAPIAAAQVPAPSNPSAAMLEERHRRDKWAEEWLASGEPAKIAWGAWLARVDRQSDRVPQLVELVNRYEPPIQPIVQTSEQDRHDAMLTVLDALIQLRGEPPVESVARLYPEFAAQSVILLVRSRDSAPPLFDIFGKAKSNGAWLAAGNMLVKQRYPGFAAMVLDRFTEHVLVSVVDKGFGYGEGGGVSGCGIHWRGPKSGWPPVGLYLLLQHPGLIPDPLEATLLADGETPVYYARAEPGSYDNPSDEPPPCNDGDRDRFRAQYLGATLGGLSSSSLGAYPQVSLEWIGEDDYRQRVADMVEQKTSRFIHAANDLVQSGWLTADEAAALHLHLELRIADRRSAPAAALPVLILPHVQFTETFSRPRL